MKRQLDWLLLAFPVIWFLSLGALVSVTFWAKLQGESPPLVNEIAASPVFTTEDTVDTGIGHLDEGMIVIVNGVEIPGLLELVLSVACEVPKE